MNKEERDYMIGDFLSGHCWESLEDHHNVECAMVEVLKRIPGNALNALYCDRRPLVIFPEVYYSYARENRLQPQWIIVLGGYLQNETLEIIVATIAHEFAHVFLGHGTLMAAYEAEMQQAKTREDEADAQAREWGFSDEINTLRRTNKP